MMCCIQRPYFNPRSPHGERLSGLGSRASQPYFNPRSPHGERRRHRAWVHHAGGNFNPRSPHGERPSRVGSFAQHRHYFNPRSPHGERQLTYSTSPASLRFQPTLPARGATAADNASVQTIEFQPTLPARGATSWKFVKGNCSQFQPTLLARGATGTRCPPLTGDHISTHAPRTGSDCALVGRHLPCVCISTHAPRTGSDSLAIFSSILTGYFNPRSPHGERRQCRHKQIQSPSFQPTLPARGATPFTIH